MKTMLLATAAVVGLAGSAIAADLRAPVKAPPVIAPPAFSWTGCYLGGFVGGAFSERDVAATGPYTPPLGPGYAYGYGTDSSFIGGGTLGCNWQPVGTPWVLGLEGEIGYIRLRGDTINPIDPTIISGVKIGDWYGMITGRLGWAAWDRTLLYVKGGAAFLPVETFHTATAVPITGTTSDDIATWTVGAGIEWALWQNWSLKAEYMFIGIDKVYSPVFFPGPVFNDVDVGGIHTAKLGLNWRFGGAAAPLLARY